MRSLFRAAVCLTAFSTLSAIAGTQLQGNGKALFWKDGKVRLRLSQAVHWDGGSSGVDRKESAESVHAALYRAIRSWERSSGGAQLRVDVDVTPAQTVSSGENVVTFTDPAPFDTGVCDKERFVACTLISFTEDGAIASASVAFNPYKRHSSLGLDGTHDIGLIMMHEMGHVLGLDHTFVADSVMQAEAEQEPAPGAASLFAVRRLSQDDLTTLARIYPPANALVAVINGKVLRSGAPVSAGVQVRVMAVDEAGRVTQGVWAGADGAFSLTLSLAKYRVAAEPADGSAVWAGEGALFEFGPDAAATPVSLEIALPPETAPGSKLTVDSVGIVAGGLYAGLRRADLPRGREHPFALTRSPLGSKVELLWPGPGIAAVAAASFPASAPQLVRQTIKVAAEAEPGAYALVVRSAVDGGFSILPNWARVVLNPRIDSVEDVESGEPAAVLAPGRRYRVRGQDLGTQPEPPPAPEEFAGAPPPTQLDSLSVRAGDQFVPLVSVRPTELIFEMPRGRIAEPGAKVKLSVWSGAAAPSNSVEMTAE